MIGDKIKKYLIDNQITQTFLSQESRITLPKLNLILSGKRHLKIEEYEIICWALKVPVDTFLEPRKPVKKVS